MVAVTVMVVAVSVSPSVEVVWGTVVVTVDMTHSYANSVSLFEVVWDVVLVVDDDVELEDVAELED